MVIEIVVFIIVDLAMLDRLLHHAVVVVTEGESFRMKEAKARGGGRSPKT